MSNQSQKVWLVTGASSGIGAAITLSALKAGHKVIAGARNPEKAAKDNPEITSRGATWLKLDVTDKQTQKVVEAAVEKAGRIDVLVNNAGYFVVGTLESWSEEEIYDIMDTNFFGACRVMKGVIPSMRKNKSGIIVGISSQNAYLPVCATSMYAASKAALEAVMESHALDLSPFNIRMAIVEPGFFRSNVFNVHRKPAAAIDKDYMDTSVGQVVGFADITAKTPDMAPGDTNKLADRVVDFVDGTGVAKGLERFLRLPLGQDAMTGARKKIESFKENVDAMEKIALSTNCEPQSEAAKMYLDQIQQHT